MLRQYKNKGVKFQDISYSLLKKLYREERESSISKTSVGGVISLIAGFPKKILTFKIPLTSKGKRTIYKYEH